jgi:hypothetical protein
MAIPTFSPTGIFFQMEMQTISRFNQVVWYSEPVAAARRASIMPPCR